eukprot:COSAG01_NODE_4712_length_4798_cov_3.005959_4_plen_97_part_00
MGPNSDGRPVGYFNVRTQVRVPFHPHVKFVSANRSRGKAAGLAALAQRTEALQRCGSEAAAAAAAPSHTSAHARASPPPPQPGPPPVRAGQLLEGT